MQQDLRKLAEMAQITILAQGDVFTLAKASVFKLIDVSGKADVLASRKSMEGLRPEDWVEVTAEGMARRSHLDKQDVNRGREIATGRALKALARKLQGNGKAVVRHRFMG